MDDQKLALNLPDGGAERFIVAQGVGGVKSQHVPLERLHVLREEIRRGPRDARLRNPHRSPASCPGVEVTEDAAMYVPQQLTCQGRVRADFSEQRLIRGRQRLLLLGNLESVEVRDTHLGQKGRGEEGKEGA